MQTTSQSSSSLVSIPQRTSNLPPRRSPHSRLCRYRRLNMTDRRKQSWPLPPTSTFQRSKIFGDVTTVVALASLANVNQNILVRLRNAVYHKNSASWACRERRACSNHPRPVSFSLKYIYSMPVNSSRRWSPQGRNPVEPRPKHWHIVGINEEPVGG